MKLSSLIASSSLLVAALAQKDESPAAETNGTVLAVFMFHNHCDRTSIIQPDQTVGNKFVASGGQMCYTDGSAYWNKYFSNSAPLKIFGTSQIYNERYVNVEVPAYDLSIQSATAFMQGLFRPVDAQSLVTDQEDVLAQDNSTFMNGPLNGYQYVPISSYRSYDPASIWVTGRELNCTTRRDASSLYFASEDYQNMVQETLSFYESLYEPYFEGVFQGYHMIYYNAYELYDYVKQNRDAGNETLKAMPKEDLEKLRAYASQLQFNLYANTTTATNLDWAEDYNRDHFREMGGRLLAGKVARTFRNAIATSGSENKFSMVLGNFDLMLSFFAIANLTSRSDDFYGLPLLGSSMVFELYTDDPTLETDGKLEPDSIKVAFGFRNGSSVDDTLTYWPLFAEEPEDDEPASMTLESFLRKMDQISISNTGQYCSLCNSGADFCQSLGSSSSNSNGDDDNESSSSSSSSASRQSSGMHPAVAGVIGAVIMLAIIGIAAVIAFFVFGVGVKRDHSRRSSVLSGIGSIGRSAPKEKLDSEIELPLSPTAAPMPGSRGFGDDDDRVYDTVSSAGTKVASPLASPQEAHFKAWESRL